MTRRSLRVIAVSLLLALASMSSAQTAPIAGPPPGPTGLPLPQAMVRLSIPDVRAFEAALGGGFRKALHNTLPDDDGVAAGFAQSQVGAKLTDQWSRFRGDTVLSFQTVLDLQTTSLALAILNVGHLEMALVLQTPLASLPELFEEGTLKTDHGRAYHVIRSGAADEGSAGETRMGLVWARDGGLLHVTTSERAMKLALAASAAGQRFSPRLAGLVSLELDTDALKQDLYFQREFLFGSLPEASESTGRIHAALRLEAGRLLEVREGTARESGRRGAIFNASTLVAGGWVSDASSLLMEIRTGLMEPWPNPSLTPRIGIAPLPARQAATAEDRYATNILEPVIRSGGTSSEAAEIDAWRSLLGSESLPGFAYAVTKARTRLLAIPWPSARDQELTSLIDATLTRRGARLMPSGTTAAGVRQYRMGPDLPVLAIRRAGDFLWLAPRAFDLQAAPAISWSTEIVRFARLNLADVSADGKRWSRIEGPKSAEHARPLSDRVLGILGWMPSVRTIEVERRVTGNTFKERVIFSYAAPAPSAAPAAK